VCRPTEGAGQATATPPAAPAVMLVEVSRLYAVDCMIEIETIVAV
jgi:hypothetical protein